MKNFIVLFALLVFACQPKEGEKHSLFNSVDSSYSNINFSNELFFTEEYNPYTFKNFLNGGGVALGDINNDGLVDIYLTGNLVENKLYLNKGNLKFEDISKSAAVFCESTWSTGAAFVDINHDGFLDLYVCKSGDPNSPNRFNQFFINNGDLTFTDKSKEYGLDFEGLSIHTAFFDYDKDGDLDCYLLNNSLRSVGAYDIIQDQRLRPDPEGGNKLLKNLEVETGQIKFEDVSAKAGIYTSAIGFGLGVSISDLNEDGWDDIFVSNDFFERDYLYLNNQDGTFKESCEDSFTELSTGSMGADIADLNNDGLPELFVTEMLPENLERYKSKTVFDSYDKIKINESKGYHRQYGRNVLQYNQGLKKGIPQFAELGRYHGVEATDWSWGALMADFDNDGLKDIFVANGIYKDLLDQDHINFYSPQQISKMLKDKKKDIILTIMSALPSEPISNYFFQQNEENKFLKSHPPNSKGFSNGAAYADFDNDGDLDLIINNINDKATLYENNSSENKYVKIKLIGEGKNINAIGTKVKVFRNDKVYMLENHPMRGYQSCISNDLIIGLGSETIIDSMRIYWPNNNISVKYNLSTDSTYKFDIKESHKSEINDTKLNKKTLLSKVEGVFDHEHIEITFPDFDRNRMIPFKLSNTGPIGSVGDLDNDGDQDVIVSGYARGGIKYFENTGKNFVEKSLPNISNPIYADRVQIEDINNDDLNDLILINGGFQHLIKRKELEDKILLNSKNGFESIPINMQMSSLGYHHIDLENDGNNELVVFPKSQVGAYGIPANGGVLKKENNRFKKSDEQSIDLVSIGMFNDIAFNENETILASSYGPLMVFTPATNGKGLDKTNLKNHEKFRGMWQDIELVDIDNDGDLDIVACNIGLNNRLHNLTQGSLYIFVKDFDKNGRTDIIFCTKKDGYHYPIHLKDELLMQMPKLKKKSLKYNDYASISMEELFGDKKGQVEAHIYNVNEWRSGIFVNDGDNEYQFAPFPDEVQYSEMKTVCPVDLNADGYMDLVLGGNQYEAKPEYGMNAASFGCVLMNKQNGNFNFLNFEDSGFFEKGQIRDILAVETNGQKHLIVLKNSDKASVYKID